MTSVGIDEVGRGCWAGPVVAGAVILGVDIDGLKDSKQLTKMQRKKLATIIHEKALAVGLGWVEPAKIDELGLTGAVRLAMSRALAAITRSYDKIIIDGHYNFLADNPLAVAIIKADARVSAVSAASIIAKVARDEYMAQLAKKYPNYGFDTHVGYGTALHHERLKVFGVSDQHRKSFKPIRELV